MFIQNIALSSQRKYMSQCQPSFGKNVVHMWLDSDGTHFPEEDQTKIHDPATKNKLNRYFNDFREFMCKFGDNIRFNLTTGRNRGEYRYYLRSLKDAGIDYLPPDKVVLKNGGDAYKNEHKDIGTFVDRGLSLDDLDASKSEEIVKITNWDANYVRSSVLRTLEDYDFPVIMAPNGNGDYKDKSVHNLLKSNKLWVAFVRQDGDFNFFIGLPKTESGIDLLPELSKKLSRQLDKKNIHYNMRVRTEDWENSNGPVIVITPKLNGEVLEKDYDVKQAIKEAQQESDLVVVAGNGSNDKKMLDPETYKDLSSSLDFPFMSVVVGHNKTLRQLATKHPDKIIAVDSAYDLKDGIKAAIDKYSKTHPDFNPYKK